MGISEKCAYIKGMVEGMELDKTSKEGKVIDAMLDLLQEICEKVTDVDDCVSEVFDQLDQIDEDIDGLAEAVYGDEEDEEPEDEDDAEYELTCPKCGEVTVVDIDTLMDETAEIHCASCGAQFDIQLLDDDEEPEE